ncbi:MAG: cysteine desulfurase family protein [Polyangiaceae bacterium]
MAQFAPDMEPVYLDYNATTPILPEVLEAMLPFLTREFGNPSSSHARGRAARAAVETAREEVAALFGVEPDEVVFTSGGTEATHLAFWGLATEGTSRRHIVTTTVEHPATLGPCAALETRGFGVTRVGVTTDGRVEAGAVAQHVDASTLLVSVMHANNETGAIMPLAEIVAHAHSQGALVHCDAAQSAGKIAVDGLGADLISVAGHKLYAPKGVGALILRRSVRITPVFVGGGQERSIRPGTENVASIVGLGKAAELCRRDLEGRRERLANLANGLLWRLRAKVPGLELNGPEHERLPNTVNVSFPGVSGNALLRQATALMASTGSACHADVESPSSVLTAMGLSPERALGAVRLSVGTLTTESEIECAVDALLAAYQALRDT